MKEFTTSSHDSFIGDDTNISNWSTSSFFTKLLNHFSKNRTEKNKIVFQFLVNCKHEIVYKFSTAQIEVKLFYVSMLSAHHLHKAMTLQLLKSYSHSDHNFAYNNCQIMYSSAYLSFFSNNQIGIDSESFEIIAFFELFHQKRIRILFIFVYL